MSPRDRDGRAPTFVLPRQAPVDPTGDLALDTLTLLTPLLVVCALLLCRFVGCTFPDVTFADPAQPYQDMIKDEPSLVAYWRLGDATGTTALDQVGAAPGTHWGTYTPVGGGLPAIATPAIESAQASGTYDLAQPGLLQGNPGASVHFDGGYVKVGYDAALNPSTFAIEAWVHPTGSARAYYTVVAARQDLGGNRRGYVIYAGPKAATPDDPKLYWQVWVGTDQPAWFMLVGPAVVLDSTVHLAVTYDGGQLKLFVDGGREEGGAHLPSEAKAVSPPYVANVGAPLYIGLGNTEAAPPPGDGNTPYFPFKGRIQEVALYNSAAIDVVKHWAVGNGVEPQS